ncbi:MAG: hypothetical protein GXN96_04590 [Aquificae bacterium]|nr:hypothetical protein [Aquificota bacterium]
MKLHPLVIYFLVGLISSAYLTYILYYGFLRHREFLLRYAMLNHFLSAVLVVLAVITGFAIQSNPYVQQKVPFVFLFPHRWIGIVLALYTFLSFALVWVKQEGLNPRLGVLMGVLGLGLTIAQVIFGWLMRLMFF